MSASAVQSDCDGGWGPVTFHVSVAFLVAFVDHFSVWAVYAHVLVSPTCRWWLEARGWHSECQPGLHCLYLALRLWCLPAAAAAGALAGEEEEEEEGEGKQAEEEEQADGQQADDQQAEGEQAEGQQAEAGAQGVAEGRENGWGVATRAGAARWVLSRRQGQSL